jgi:hypothetical protein
LGKKRDGAKIPAVSCQKPVAHAQLSFINRQSSMVGGMA